MSNTRTIFASAATLLFLFVLNCAYRSVSTATSSASSRASAYNTSRYTDTIYLSQIKSLYFQIGKEEVYEDIRTPILRLRQLEHLLLSFDVLSATPVIYEAYIVACDAYWQPLANHFDFVEGINRYTIDPFRSSSAQGPAYVHYRFSIPKVLYAGNYALIVHHAYDTEARVLSARFMVYNEQVQVGLKLRRSSSTARYKKVHRIAVSMAPRDLARANPYTDFLLILRQNGNPATTQIARSPSRPTGDKVFLYDPIDHTQVFCAPPNFRAFDIRHINFRGTHIDKWRVQTPQIYEAYLAIDYPRTKQSYRLNQDLNGKYVLGGIEEVDFRGTYVQVHVKLKIPEPLHTPIYIVGDFNQWLRSAAYQLVYDSLNRYYAATLHVKQGYYEYLYWTAGGFETLEGCHVSSENYYEAFIYHVDRFSRRMPLVGYATREGLPQ